MASSNSKTKEPKSRAKLQVLVACVDENPILLAQQMNLQTEAVLCNQCHETAEESFVRNGREIRAYSFEERGVGKNRNAALMRADAEFVLFADDDIIYVDDYEERILQEFARNPKADILMFNVEAVESRKTYENVRHKRVRWFNYGRYPTYSMCCRLESILGANVFFSLLYGGGARYSNGEDSLFLHDCLKKGLKIYGVPVAIGHENKRENEESTWFKGYTEKFFFDRGVLYYDLYGPMKRVFALRFLLKHRAKMCQEIPLAQAYRLMKQGMKMAGQKRRLSFEEYTALREREGRR